jgi:hypothetical protein
MIGPVRFVEQTNPNLKKNNMQTSRDRICPAR